MNTPRRSARWLGQATLLAAFSLGNVALHAQEMVVSAAASLTNAFQAMGQAFEKTRPGVKVTFNFAASGPLLAQIQQGAPVDVFASADQETMDRAAKAGLLADGSRADFARNTLVLIVPATAVAATTPPQTLADLGSATYRRIATGTPSSVPVGRYTVAAVQDAGLAAALTPKWIYGESVRQVLNYVARGEVDAGFVYRTDALIEKDKTRIALTVPTRTPVSYPIAQVAASKNAAVGKDFVAFVRSDAGQRILDGFGFSKP
ncbi:molybdate ABC transporter substrate-binding protein [Variovorax arabinosiphilus]|uniref:molybdate ABC transporter substrate-binding protein n=1 Tax=Variovorax arabinosiphilus TaxID=3053498 RepID=UPI002576C1B4|nr:MULTISPECIES: molybdate ABC transporter substrate-binding protein [unclassified Variovorax]MDM0122911.1 molybdate ABC transporter substrate-binding protein [Variovorax sp. J2L1-78]MDM0132093.1 molybdate ABC transporter substrate-binding protein [Variovorax sp. J2L1-63]MDM0235674.1 molybdate ABC transporter substrate-binding protein [Variovorax sp. J2R1-6]